MISRSSVRRLEKCIFGRTPSGQVLRIACKASSIFEALRVHAPEMLMIEDKTDPGLLM
jgi:hypothetical protein